MKSTNADVAAAGGEEEEWADEVKSPSTVLVSACQPPSKRHLASGVQGRCKGRDLLCDMLLRSSNTATCTGCLVSVRAQCLHSH